MAEIKIPRLIILLFVYFVLLLIGSYSEPYIPLIYLQLYTGILIISLIVILVISLLNDKLLNWWMEYYTINLKR